MVNIITKYENLISKNSMKELAQKNSEFAESRKEDVLEIFNSIPMPKEKDEEWRYTEIEKLKLESFAPFESGVKILVAELSDELVKQGVILTDINSALEKYPAALNYFFKSCKADNDKFVALAAAHFNHGIFLYVPKNIEIKDPIRVNFDIEGKNGILHNLIVVESNAHLDFIEQYSNKQTEGEQLSSCVTEVFANTNSRINFYHLNNWADKLYNLTNITGTADRNASINWVSGCFGGKLNRIRI